MGLLSQHKKCLAVPCPHSQGVILSVQQWRTTASYHTFWDEIGQHKQLSRVLCLGAYPKTSVGGHSSLKKNLSIYSGFYSSRVMWSMEFRHWILSFYFQIKLWRAGYLYVSSILFTTSFTFLFVSLIHRWNSIKLEIHWVPPMWKYVLKVCIFNLEARFKGGITF